MENIYHQNLLSALVGLARATDGNEHLLNAGTDAAAVAGLRTLLGDSEENAEAMTARVREEKRRLVPDCFYCANPCGRTQDMDIGAFYSQRAELRERKMELLNRICRLAEESEPDMAKIYKGLFVLGCEDWDEEEVETLARELQPLPDRK